MSSKKKVTFVNLADVNPIGYEFDETRLIQTKNSKNNPVVVKTGLKSSCKRLNKSAVRENYSPKPDPQMKKTQSHKRRYSLHQHKESKGNL